MNTLASGSRLQPKTTTTITVSRAIASEHRRRLPLGERQGNGVGCRADNPGQGGRHECPAIQVCNECQSGSTRTLQRNDSGLTAVAVDALHEAIRLTADPESGERQQERHQVQAMGDGNDERSRHQGLLLRRSSPSVLGRMLPPGHQEETKSNLGFRCRTAPMGPRLAVCSDAWQILVRPSPSLPSLLRRWSTPSCCGTARSGETRCGSPPRLKKH